MIKRASVRRVLRKGALRRCLVIGLIVALPSLGVPGAHAQSRCVPDAQQGGQWPMSGHSLSGDRFQDQEHLIGRAQAATLKPAWTFNANQVSGEINNEITGAPIVADGCVFVGSSRGHDQPGWVFAIDADGGQRVWATRLPFGVYATMAAGNGLVYAYMSRIGHPTLVALRIADGSIAWSTEVDSQPGSDAVSSPIIYDGMVWVGVSGTAAEGDESNRFDFRGASVLLDAATGEILAHAYSIPDDAWRGGQGDSGASIWSTISVDTETGFGYVGTGNPFNYDHESPHANAVLKIDLRRTVAGAPNPSLGGIAGSYKGHVDEYFPDVATLLNCDANTITGLFLAGFDCAHLDLDFGAQPNIFKDRLGNTLVGDGQKSGVYHVFNPDTMQEKWKTLMGVPSLVGGIVGSAAYDGSAIYAPHTIGGYLAALDRGTGSIRWASPVADAVHWGPAVAAANGVLYTVDFKGFLDAVDAQTGAPLLHRPMALGSDTGANPTISWGGTTVARHTVYASIGVGLTSTGDQYPAMPNGFVIAYRPALLL